MFCFEFGDFKHMAKSQMPVYRGIYSHKEKDQYEIGDVVTYSGSLYIKQQAGDDRPKLASTTWRLCTKKPRDGADGKSIKGDRGERGPKGEPGRDAWRGE